MEYGVQHTDIECRDVCVSGEIVVFLHTFEQSAHFSACIADAFVDSDIH